jgi:GntR family transcriptional regulator
VITRDGPVAPWRQVFELYRQRIETGELPPGARLPSIRGMSQEFGIAGTTAQKVIAALKADGLVVTSPMGTYVRGNVDD